MMAKLIWRKMTSTLPKGCRRRKANITKRNYTEKGFASSSTT